MINLYEENTPAETILFKNGICYNHSKYKGWHYQLKDSKITFTSNNNEQQSFDYVTYGKGSFTIISFNDELLTNCVQFAKPFPDYNTNTGTVVFYTNTMEYINTASFLATNVYIDSIYAGSLTVSIRELPSDGKTIDGSVIKVKLPQGEYSYYSIMGLGQNATPIIKDSFIVNEGKTTKVFIDANKLFRKQ